MKPPRRREVLAVVLVATSVLFGGMIVAPEALAAPAPNTLAYGIGQLRIAAEDRTGYTRSAFKYWIDDDRDCQDTRSEVLQAEARAKVSFQPSSRCAALTGRWRSAVDGRTWTRAADVDIDHHVPLAEAWDSGARWWSAARREAFANDLSYAGSLNVITDNVNILKGNRDPSDWMPPRAAARCTYVKQWIAVKYRWNLSIDAKEKRTLHAVAAGKCGRSKITLPTRITKVAGDNKEAGPQPPHPVVRNPSTLLIHGNFQSYADGAFSAYTGMWGLRQASNVIASSSMRVTPSAFPRGTTFTWDVIPDPAWSGVNGYLHLAYGNYDDSPSTITPRRVTDITELSLDIGWTFQGDERSGLLAECWLSSAPAPSGALLKTHEIGFMPKPSPAAKQWLSSLPTVGRGSFVDSEGIRWHVRKSTSGTGEPYLVAHRAGYISLQGELPFHDYLTFLISAGEITGDEWFNGVSFGVEPHSGAGSLTITKFAPRYEGL